MAESVGASLYNDVAASLRSVGEAARGPKKEKGEKKAPTPEGMEGRRKPPRKAGRWLRRNVWRLWLGAAVAVVLLVFAVLGVVEGRSLAATISGLELAAVAVGALAAWWRVSEMAAVGVGPVGRFVRRRRQARVLRSIRDQWRAAVIELKWLAPPSFWQAVGARVGVYPKGPFPACEIRNLRLDMIGGVVADLHWRRLGNVAKGGPYGFEKPKNTASLALALAFETGHRRRVSKPPRWLERWGAPWMRQLWSMFSIAGGEERYVLRPREIQFAAAKVGEGDSLVRLAYPSTDADLLIPDTAPAPDHSRVRLALGRDVIYWNRDTHAHLGVFGPTNKGKGHILRRIAWQLLQIGQLVVMIDGQGGSEHGLFRRLKNYWWFDAPQYKRDHGAAGLAPWVLDSLTVEEAAKLGEIPEALYHQVAHLVYVRNQLRGIVAMGWERNEIADRNLGKGWHEWPEHEQRAAPRINVLIDEGNTLLSKGTGPGALGELLRKEIGALIGVLLFGGRKYGIHVVFGAQILYAASWMARGMYAQLGLVSVSGTMPSVHQMMTTQVADWPPYPDEVGYGIVTAYANAMTMEAVRYPPAFQDAFAEAIDVFLWELELAEASAASPAPEPVGVAES